MEKFNIKTKLSKTSLLSTTMPNLSLKWEGKEHVNVLSTHSLNWKIVLMHFAQGLFHQKPTDMTCNLQTFLGLSSLSFIKSHYGLNHLWKADFEKNFEAVIYTFRWINKCLVLIQINRILYRLWDWCSYRGEKRVSAHRLCPILWSGFQNGRQDRITADS